MINKDFDHYCMNWDMMFITMSDSEIVSCTCFSDLVSFSWLVKYEEVVLKKERNIGQEILAGIKEIKNDQQRKKTLSTDNQIMICWLGIWILVGILFIMIL